MAGSTRGEIDYITASVGLRAPRVAVVVPASDNWPHAFQLAVRQCAQTWGGAGFILIPHVDGVVDPLFLRLAAAYDPDHVVVAQARLGELVRVQPDWHKPTSDGRRLSADEVDERFPEEWAALSPHDELAATRVAKACAPFRSDRTFVQGDEPLYDTTRLPRGGSNFPNNPQRDLVNVELAPSTDPVSFDDRKVALAAAWVGGFAAIGLAVPDAQTRFDLTPEELADRIRSLVSVPDRSVDWAAQADWQPSLRGLTPLIHFRARDTYWLVVGDTLADLALAHDLSRMCHGGWWIPSVWFEADSPYRSAARAIVSRARNLSRSEPLRVTSTSMDPAEALALSTHPGVSVQVTPHYEWAVATSTDSISAQTGGLQLALAKDYDRDLALPVRVTPDGDRRLINPLPPQIPETAAVFEDPQLDWVIDVSFGEHSTPRGRWLEPEPLQWGDDPWRERVRSGRDGVSIMSASYGFVPVGATPRQRTARPRLVALGLSSWAREMARTSRLEFRTSEAGHLAAVGARLWGSRLDLVTDLSSYLPLFQSFMSTKDRTRDRYPADDGVVLRREGPQGFPTFAALQTSLAQISSDIDAARSIVDRLLQIGAIRRGLIVNCAACSLIQFTQPTNPEFSTECGRCGAHVLLSQAAWKQPADEPRWFYDLHPALRRMLKDNGDVPLLAEAMLGKKKRYLVGLPEHELHGPSGLDCEIDLLAGTTDYVVVGEAKTTPAIPPNQVKKKVRALTVAAQVFRADEVLLASGARGEWDEGLIDKLRVSLAAQDWASGALPTIRLMTGLRGDSPTDDTVT